MNMDKVKKAIYGFLKDEEGASGLNMLWWRLWWHLLPQFEKQS